MSVAVIVANIHYAQPLLASMAHDFGVSPTTVGMVVTAGQAGYAVGLILLVPLGDITPPRSLLVTLVGLNAVALAASTVIPGLTTFVCLMALVGLVSVAVTVAMAVAAGLATDAQRPAALGTLLAGMLTGVLAARAFSGVLAGLIGWRWVYAVAAILMSFIAFTLHRKLPATRPHLSLGYRAQLHGVLQAVSTQPVLRWRATVGGCVFGAFGCFWTTVTFLLAERYRWSEAQIGLFALVGAAGAVSAILGGRFLSGRPHTQRWTFTAVIGVVFALSFAPMYLVGNGLAWLIVGVIVMDGAVQALNVLNQTVAYDLMPEARSRISTVYASAMFLGGAVGTTLGSIAYDHFGWTGATSVAMALAVGALLGTLGTRRHEKQKPFDQPARGPKRTRGKLGSVDRS
ncbi:MFS transporter [Nocardia brasiliensis]|uniref:MFS transporter n=1 Tax=Nocardia brasiliensis TaxID=37326 RepID=UPI002455F182|nr:MFS transporter [Nocardia brasiliensis]